MASLVRREVAQHTVERPIQEITRNGGVLITKNTPPNYPKSLPLG